MPHGDITHIDIPVSDTARAQAFYAGLFGWQIAELPGFSGSGFRVIGGVAHAARGSWGLRARMR